MSYVPAYSHFNQPIIMSNLKVHREQMPKGTFFEATEAKALTQIIIDYPKNSGSDTERNYQENIKSFAKSFLKAVF